LIWADIDFYFREDPKLRKRRGHGQIEKFPFVLSDGWHRQTFPKYSVFQQGLLLSLASCCFLLRSYDCTTQDYIQLPPTGQSRVPLDISPTFHINNPYFVDIRNWKYRKLTV